MLPKISHPTIDVNVPSLKKKIRLRPMLVKEEKILLFAKESKDESDIFTAIKQVVNNCIVTPNTNVNEFTIFDLEYLFLKIRSFSISNISNVSYIDNEDQKVYDFQINLEKIEVSYPESISNTIKIDDKISVQLKYPSAKLYDDKQMLLKSENLNELVDYVIKSCIDKIFVGDEIHDIKNASEKELDEFLESLPIKAYDNIKDFFNNTPSLKYEIDYKNSLGNDRKIILSTLNDFFTFR
jgi:hypothetical protein